MEQEVAPCGTTTPQLLALWAWLQAWEVTHVAMESTGVSWKPVWTILAGHVELWLVNARHWKTVPGRKTDVKDAEGIAQLRQYGCLRGSCVPSPEVRQWRDVTRHRTQLTGQRTSVVNRIHTVLEDANVKVSAVSSDRMGVSGQRMVRAMGAGEDDAAALSQLGRAQWRASQEVVQESVQGKRTAHHRFMLEGWFDQVALLDTQLARVDARLEEHMRPCEAQRRRLDTIDGMDRVGAQSFWAEWGPDMAPLPDADHLARWAGMRPGNDERAGKRRSGKTAKGNQWLRRPLTQAAWAAPRHQGGSLAAQYRRLASRRGKNRAIVAVGYTILVAAYDILQDEGEDHDLGAEHCDRLRRERTVSHWVRRFQRLGYNVSLETIASDAA